MADLSIPAVADADAISLVPRDGSDLDDLEALADRLAHRYRELRRTVDTSGTLFARHELQSALIEVRRLRRGIAAVEAELEAELSHPPARHPGRPLRVVRDDP